MLRANPDEWDGNFRNVVQNPKVDISATDGISRNNAISFDNLTELSAFDVTNDLKELLRKGRGNAHVDRLNSGRLPSLGMGHRLFAGAHKGLTLHKEEARKCTSKENSLTLLKCAKGSKSPCTNKNVGLRDNEEISKLAGDEFLVSGDLGDFNFDDYAVLSYR